MRSVSGCGVSASQLSTPNSIASVNSSLCRSRPAVNRRSTVSAMKIPARNVTTTPIRSAACTPVMQHDRRSKQHRVAGHIRDKDFAEQDVRNHVDRARDHAQRGHQRNRGRIVRLRESAMRESPSGELQNVARQVLVLHDGGHHVLHVGRVNGNHFLCAIGSLAFHHRNRR